MQNGISAYLKRLIKDREFPTYLLVFSSFAILGVRFFYFIFKYTPNILYWDQWDIVDQILKHNYISDLFIQHSEHRIGVGLIITKFIESFTHWNSRAETLLVGLIVFTSSILAIILKRRLVGKIEIFDIVIPFIFLQLYQWENILWGFQIAFTLPLVLLLASLCLYTYKDSFLRNISLILFVFLSTYSSFHGIFLGFLTALFFFLNLLLVAENKERLKFLVLACLSSILSLIYFIGFVKAPFLGQNKFSLVTFFKFILLEINSFVGFIPKDTNISQIRLILLSFLLLVIPILLVTSLLLLIRQIKDKTQALKLFPILALFLFSILFCFSTAYGRSGLTLAAAVASRYTTFLIPGFFASYLTISLIVNKLFKVQILTFIIVTFVFISSSNNYLNYQQAVSRTAGLNSWKTCYLQNNNVETCNKKVNFLIFPENRSEFLQQKLEELKKEKINLFDY